MKAFPIMRGIFFSRGLSLCSAALRFQKSFDSLSGNSIQWESYLGRLGSGVSL